MQRTGGAGKLFSLGYRGVAALLLLIVAGSVIHAFASLSGWASIAASGMIAVGLLWGIRLFSELPAAGRVQRWAAAFLLLVIAAEALAAGLRLTSVNDTDLVYLRSAALRYLETGTIPPGYFSLYPFQRFYTYILIAVYGLASALGADPLSGGAVWGALLIVLDCWAVWRICGMQGEKGKRVGLAALMFCALNPNLSFYASYYYTYMAAGTAVILGLLVYLKAMTGQRTELRCVLCGFLLHSGYKIRATAAILAIALVIDVLFLRKDRGGRKIRILLFAAAGAGLSFLLWLAADRFFNVALDPEKAYPVSSWILMGLNSESHGAFSDSIRDLASSYETAAERTAAMNEALRERIGSMGLGEWLSLEASKMANLFAVGRYHITVDLDNVRVWTDAWDLTLGDGGGWLLVYCQGQRAAVLLGTARFLAGEVKRKEPGPWAGAAVFLFGYVLFYSFWEVKQSYINMLMPVLMLMCAAGACSPMREKHLRLPERMQAATAAAYLLGTVLLACVLIPGALSARSTACIAAMQTRSGPAARITEEGLTQTVVCGRAFDTLTLRVPKAEEGEGGDRYSLTIRDADGEILQEIPFEPADAKDGTLILSFEPVAPDGTCRYSLTLSASGENTGEMSVRTVRSADSYADFYPDGEIAGDDTGCWDLCFTLTGTAAGPVMPVWLIAVLTAAGLLWALMIFGIIFRKRMIRVSEED